MSLKNTTSELWEMVIDYAQVQPQGVLLYYKGIPFPRRVYYDKRNDPNYFLRVLYALGTIKKTFYSLFYLKSAVIPYRFTIKGYEPFLTKLWEISKWNLDGFYIKDEEFSVPVWELGKFIQRFLWELGLGMDLSASYARLAMMILEFDNAYRYRVQDLFGAVHQGWFVFNPKVWFKKALEAYLQREILHQDNPEWGARGKIARSLKLMSWAMYLPKVRKAWQKAAENIIYENILFDQNDRCHFSFWHGYDFEGKTFEERYAPYKKMFEAAPYRKRDDPKIYNNFLTGNDD